jgi:SAM-dependent methyltransferase
VADADEPAFDLADAYSVSSPADNRRLYAAWATTYDRDFLATHGYVYHESVVAAMLERRRPDGPVLDVGCGTGVVGAELKRRGVAVVDGVDLSPEMLEVAATKMDDSGVPVYRNLIEADLTTTTPIARGEYSAVVSAGTFTHGHLGPEPIDELLAVGRRNAVFALGVNGQHFDAAGFGDWFAAAIDDGRVRDLEVVELPIYDRSRYSADDADQHAGTVAAVAVFLGS